MLLEPAAYDSKLLLMHFYLKSFFTLKNLCIASPIYYKTRLHFTKRILELLSLFYKSFVWPLRFRNSFTSAAVMQLFNLHKGCVPWITTGFLMICFLFVICCPSSYASGFCLRHFSLFHKFSPISRNHGFDNCTYWLLVAFIYFDLFLISLDYNFLASCSFVVIAFWGVFN